MVAMRTTTDPGPPELPGARQQRIKAKVPLFFAMVGQAIRDGRAAGRAAELARCAQIGVDTGRTESGDFGPGIRQSTIRDGGIMLRAADVQLEYGPDPDKPNATVRRARLADPLEVLYLAATISGRQMDAGKELRSQVEAVQGGIPCASNAAPRGSGGSKAGISEWQVDACKRARQALAAVPKASRPVVLWVVLGGTLDGFAAFAHVRRRDAARHLPEGLEAIADHFYGPATRRIIHSIGAQLGPE
jgi:hypothetical protein